MKAVVIEDFGGPEVLRVGERIKPDIGENEVLIKVFAAGVNRPDVFQRKGNYPAPSGVDPMVPGLEVSGKVVEIGKNVTTLILEDRVMALVAGGGYAEYVAVDASICLPIPESVSFEEAAGMPETLFTVWSNVFQRGKLAQGESFLVHGGSGGIGSTAIQLASLLGFKVFTTVGSEEKKIYAQSIGAFKAFNYQKEDFEKQLSNEKVDVILDAIGGDYFAKNINILNEEGRLIYINAMKGAKVEVNLLKIMQKRIFISGSTLRNRSIEFKAAIAEDLKKWVLPLIVSRTYKTNVFKVFSYTEAAEAHKLMESRNFMGKIILKFN